jgi:acyl dehydratase
MPEVGEAIPELVRVVTAADVKAYADAGGDQNPLHQDDGFARSLGFSGVIAHGMFTMGQMAAAVTAYAGDPSAVREISAQFRTAVLMGEEIVAGGTVVSIDGDTATIDTWVRLERAGETLWPIKKGRAIIAIA